LAKERLGWRAGFDADAGLRTTIANFERLFK